MNENDKKLFEDWVFGPTNFLFEVRGNPLAQREASDRVADALRQVAT
jgi:hypothetical protein